MWSAQVCVLEVGRVQKVLLLRDSKPLPYADVVRLWQYEEGFRAFFISVLAEAPFSAYFWETPPVTEFTLDKTFEFVLVDSPHFGNARADARAFATHFDSTRDEEEVVTFPNLGRDALLVVPCPCGPLSAYPHIASFTREAPEFQNHALWQCVGRALERRIHDRPVWLSTAGLGVFWVHVRIDSRPKYYSFDPYRDPDKR